MGEFMPKEAVSAIEELKDEVKNAFSNRLRSPFVGVFMFSWLAWNHRLLFVLFADMRVGKRFDYIDNDLYPTVQQFVALNLLWPLVSTIIYIVLVPLLTEGVHHWNLWNQRRLRAAELRSQGRDLLTERESVHLRSIITSRNSAIADLRSKLHKSSVTAKGYKAMYSAILHANSELPVEVLKDFLLSDHFSLRESIDLGADVSVHEFEQDGQVHSSPVSRDRSINAEFWRFDGAALKLLAGDGEVLAEFNFNGRSGQFEGGTRLRDAVLVSRSM